MEDFSDIIDNVCCSEIRPSPLHGHGLFAVIPMAKGTILGFLDGQYVPWNAKFAATFEWNAVAEDTLLVRHHRTKYSFINHSREPNVELKPFPLRMVALAPIAAGEELTLDYRKESLSQEYLDGHGKTFL